MVERQSLKEVLDNALLATDSPHVNIGPLLGVRMPVRVGLDDVHALLESEEPAFSLEVGDAAITVRKQDGGMLAELELKW